MNTPNSMPRVVGWLIGALSLVTLVQALISFRLHASIQYLVLSYHVAVSHLFGVLTGWITLPWFSVNQIEQHFIVILAICQSVLLKASRRHAGSTASLILAGALFLLADIVIFGLIPDSFLITPVFVAILMLVAPLYLERNGDIRPVGYTTNLIGITSFFLAITVINSVLTIV